MPHQTEVGQVLEHLATPDRPELAPTRQPPDDLCHLDVDQVRGVKRLVAAGQPFIHLHRRRQASSHAMTADASRTVTDRAH
jgi:hypothetical protein